MKVIKLKSKGPDVRKWQEFLKSQKYRITVDGNFGPQTERATKAIQKRKKLKADGIVGPNTWKLIPQKTANKPAANNSGFQVLKKGSFGEQVKQWQLFLQSAGYELPFVDGAFGPETERETIKFQKKNGLKPDGIVGPQTWKFITNVSHNTPLSQKWPKQNYTDMVNFYGPVGENMTSLEIPYAMKLAWNKNVTVKKFTCHQKCAKSFYAVLEKVLKTYGEKEIQRLGLNLFGGCLNVRKMRGGSSFSTHSWGCAIDLDPDNNQLRWGKDRAKMARPEYNDYWKIVESEGGVSLGRERNMDFMHWQFANL